MSFSSWWRKRKDRREALPVEQAPAPPPLTAASVARAFPLAAEELRSEGAAAERTRIAAVYHSASLVTLDPLIERLMFDGRTPPEAAALAVLAQEGARAVIVDELQRRRQAFPEAQ